MRRFMHWFIDINVYMARMNEIYDALTIPGATVDGKSLEEIFEPSWLSRNPLRFLFLHSRSRMFVDSEAPLFIPAMQAGREAWRRIECSENLQRLALALLLYEKEHGELPGENWIAAITPYLAGTPHHLAGTPVLDTGVPAKWFSCPSNPSPEGKTTYALVQYGNAVADSRDVLLLVELEEAVLFAEAVITVDEILARQRTGSLHLGGMNTAYHNGAVRFLSDSTDEEELLRLLGREVAE
jgi:hypothetical protein